MIVDRDISKSRQVELPAGLRIVSADSHLEIGDDIFIEKFPDRLKNKAPRVWFDKYWHIGYKGETEALKLGERGTNSLIRSNLASVADVAPPCLSKGS